MLNNTKGNIPPVTSGLSESGKQKRAEACKGIRQDLDRMTKALDGIRQLVTEMREEEQANLQRLRAH